MHRTCCVTLRSLDLDWTKTAWKSVPINKTNTTNAVMNGFILAIPPLLVVVRANEASSVMGHDDSWPATVPSAMPSLRYSLSEKASRKRSNGGTVLPITYLMEGSKSGNRVSYLSFLVTIHLSCLDLEICTCDRQTNERTMRTITIAGPHIVAGKLITLYTCTFNLAYVVR